MFSGASIPPASLPVTPPASHAPHPGGPSAIGWLPASFVPGSVGVPEVRHHKKGTGGAHGKTHAAEEAKEEAEEGTYFGLLLASAESVAYLHFLAHWIGQQFPVLLPARLGFDAYLKAISRLTALPKPQAEAAAAAPSTVEETG